MPWAPWPPRQETSQMAKRMKRRRNEEQRDFEHRLEKPKQLHTNAGLLYIQEEPSVLNAYLV